MLELCDIVERGVDEYDELLTENPIWRERTVGVGRASPPRSALALGVTGPILRSTGFAWDLRKAQPYLAYDEVDFDVIYTENGDVLRPLPHPALRDPRVDEDRAPVRRADAGRRLPRAGQEGHAAAARAHRRVDGSADPPLQAVHRGLQGAGGRDVRRGRVAARRDRLLPGERRHRASRCACTSAGRPSTTCSRWTRWCAGSLVADAVAIVSSIDPIMGEVDR